jgi:hypothetical protein
MIHIDDQGNLIKSLSEPDELLFQICSTSVNSVTVWDYQTGLSANYKYELGGFYKSIFYIVNPILIAPLLIPTPLKILIGI